MADTSPLNTTAGYDPLTDPTLDHTDIGPVVMAIAIVFGGVSAVAVGLRLYTRIGILGTAGWDDWTILIASIFSVGVTITTVLEAKFALGRHYSVMKYFPEDVLKQLQSLYAVILMYNFAMNVVKISFLLQYRRIFRGKIIKRVCTWFMVYVCLWAIAQDTTLGLACLPVSIIIPSMETKCLHTLRVWYVSSAMNIVTDFAIFLIPLPVIAGLQLKKKQKKLVFGVFCLGFFTCIISIIRIFTLKSAAVTTDETWDNVGAACWTVVELNCAILCSCLPTLKPLLAKMIPGLSSNGSGGYEMYADGTARARATGTGTNRGRRAQHPAAVNGIAVGSSSRRAASSGSQEALKENAANYEYEKNGTTTMAYASKDLHASDSALAEEDGKWSANMPGGIMVTKETRVEEKGRRII